MASRVVPMLLVACRVSAFDLGDTGGQATVRSHDAALVLPYLTFPTSSAPAQGKDRAANVVTMLHAMGANEQGEPNWEKRTTIMYENRVAVAGRPSGTVFQLHPSAMQDEEVDRMKTLIEAGGVYSIRIPSKLADPESPPIIASVDACSLALSSFKEHIVVHLDSVGSVLSVGYYVPSTAASCEGLAAKVRAFPFRGLRTISPPNLRGAAWREDHLLHQRGAPRSPGRGPSTRQALWRAGGRVEQRRSERQCRW